MSSMVALRFAAFALLASTALGSSVPLAAQTPADGARMQMVAAQPGVGAASVARWQLLTSNDMLSFADYAGFVLANPGFPREDVLRKNAEAALERGAPGPEQVVAFFDRNPPLSNPARARYALALSALGRPEAAQVAREAWRGGRMSSPAEAYLVGAYGGTFTPDDQDARMASLLWQGDQEAAARQIAAVSPAKRNLFMARLALLQGQEPASIGLSVPPGATSDPGFVYNQARYYRKTGQAARGVQLLATRGPFAHLPHDAEDLVTEMLILARTGDARSAQRIAASVDDLFAPDADISGMSYKLRDDYTSLMWLGGTKALWDLGDGNAAAPLFYRYGNAARTPQTRSKGFYWAGLASARAGRQADAQRYFEMAAQYPEYFYGQLALERLGRPLTAFAQVALVQPTAAQRAAFQQNRLVQAIRATARNGTDWRTERYFFTALADSAQDAAHMQLVAELAEELDLPELAVVVGRTAPEKGLTNFTRTGFPTVATPAGADFTMVHAIARQESEFDINRTSHAGASGLMQLMPGTAREQAGKLGMSYLSANLTTDPAYNIRLGDAYFARMMDYYGGSYPLAVAADNAGPGNVNKWLRANGDPRAGSVDWLRWIEQIPIFETKNYVQRVLENAVVYEAMYPDKVRYGEPKGISRFLGKNTPG
jgi:soluble lytic murein transglycosylase